MQKTTKNAITTAKKGLLFAPLLITLLLTISASHPLQAQTDSDDIGLFGLEFEEAMDIEVISTTRTPGQDVFTSPSAIYVITQEQIRRSGHRSIPELLRMVPGMYVAKIDGGKWIVSSRGFPELFYRMMLVQIDGRTVYSPVFSGVFWEAQDYVLDDIERIEIVRGPGASLWGANAFNGIVNIITKKAKDTQGGLIVGGAGTEERGFGTLRYGGKTDNGNYYRIYGKISEHDKTATFGEADFTDDRGTVQGGFRFDFEETEDQTFTLQGDWHRNRTGHIIRNADIPAGTNPIATTDTNIESWNILARWNRNISDTSDEQLVMYYDWNKLSIEDSSVNFQERWEIFDVDYQKSFCLDDTQRIVWGLNYRLLNATFDNITKLSFKPSQRTLSTFSGFVQDTITLSPEKLDLILGIKLEHNDLTGFEYQPRAALVWTPDDKNTVWTSVSRALRVPSLVNNDETITFLVIAPDAPAIIIPNNDYKAEEVISYELGYRYRPTNKFSLDVTAFYNEYDNMESITPVGPLTFQWDNDQSGNGYGTEISANYNPTDKWRLSASYTWLQLHLDNGDESFAKRAPQNQFQIHSYYDINDNLEFNAAIYYYDNNATESISSFARLDLGMTWHINKNTDFGVWGQNLLDPQKQEFGPDAFFSGGGGQVQRGIYAFIKMRF